MRSFRPGQRVPPGRAAAGSLVPMDSKYLAESAVGVLTPLFDGTAVRQGRAHRRRALPGHRPAPARRRRRGRPSPGGRRRPGTPRAGEALATVLERRLAEDAYFAGDVAGVLARMPAAAMPLPCRRPPSRTAAAPPPWAGSPSPRPPPWCWRSCCSPSADRPAAGYGGLRGDRPPREADRTRRPGGARPARLHAVRRRGDGPAHGGGGVRRHRRRPGVARAPRAHRAQRRHVRPGRLRVRLLHVRHALVHERRHRPRGDGVGGAAARRRGGLRAGRRPGAATRHPPGRRPGARTGPAVRDPRHRPRHVRRSTCSTTPARCGWPRRRGRCRAPRSPPARGSASPARSTCRGGSGSPATRPSARTAATFPGCDPLFDVT